MIDRFNEKVFPEPNTGCWLWSGATFTENGYGTMWYNHGYELTHRISYIIHKGDIPDGMCVCHTCDNKSCVNPEHLWLGTTQENTRDKVFKGRQSKGASHGMSKLTESQIIEIRQNKNNHRIMAEKFGVTIQTISYVKRKLIWGHIK